jgi:hypothetical protein
MSGRVFLNPGGTMPGLISSGKIRLLAARSLQPG